MGSVKHNYCYLPKNIPLIAERQSANRKSPSLTNFPVPESILLLGDGINSIDSLCSATFIVTLIIILSSLHLGLVQLCLEGLVMRHSGGCERFLITKQVHKKKNYCFVRDVPP